MKQRVKLLVRPTVKGKRRWIEVNPKKQYEPGTIFTLRWLPERAKNYRYESCGAVGLDSALRQRMSQEIKLMKEPETEAEPAKSPLQKQTLEELRDAFLEDKSTTFKSDGSSIDGDTVQTYKLVTREFLDTVKRTMPSQITRQDLKNWMAQLRKRLEHNSVCNYYKQIAGFLKFCGIDHRTLLPKNERPKPTYGTPEAFTQEEMTKFFFAITDEREALVFEFLLKTGARKNEMAFLTWDCLNLSSSPTVRFGSADFRTKTGTERTIPLERELANKLSVWREKNPTTKYVFGKNGDQPYSKYLRVCTTIAQRAGMNPEKFWLHKFRDTFATWALRRGVDIRTVQHWLGHANITMTQKYLAPEQGEHAQNQINKAFSGGRIDHEASAG
jgi:integrase/recombinase XerD